MYACRRRHGLHSEQPVVFIDFPPIANKGDQGTKAGTLGPPVPRTYSFTVYFETVFMAAAFLPVTFLLAVVALPVDVPAVIFPGLPPGRGLERDTAAPDSTWSDTPLSRQKHSRCTNERAPQALSGFTWMRERSSRPRRFLPPACLRVSATPSAGAPPGCIPTCHCARPLPG